MKRFHVHVGVRDLQQSIRFYSAMFAAAPVVSKPDYAKWMLDPQGIAWESFHSLDSVPVYGEDRRIPDEAGKSACCAPASS